MNIKEIITATLLFVAGVLTYFVHADARIYLVQGLVLGGTIGYLLRVVEE